MPGDLTTEEKVAAVLAKPITKVRKAQLVELLRESLTRMQGFKYRQDAMVDAERRRRVTAAEETGE
jgi:hypothetical protein